MTKHQHRRDLPPDMPSRIRALPVDERRYPVPWFVATINGKPDFRVIKPGGIQLAVKHDSCWICGQRNYKTRRAFVIGPMCAINRTSSEPPCHPECAIWSAKACPFLTRPKSVRREANMPDDAETPAGIMLPRNPGVALVWIVDRYSIVDDGRSSGWLFKLPDPHSTLWFAEGREANRLECTNSIESGLPILHQMAAEEGEEAIAFLNTATLDAYKYLPAH
jgi:hypothetical protein